MRCIPPTLRALVLVPLLAVLVDSARATVACGPQAETCLEAAGRGWLGAAGIALLGVYSVVLALAVGEDRRRGRHARPPAPARPAVADRQPRRRGRGRRPGPARGRHRRRRRARRRLARARRFLRR